MRSSILPLWKFRHNLGSLFYPLYYQVNTLYFIVSPNYNNYAIVNIFKLLSLHFVRKYKLLTRVVLLVHYKNSQFSQLSKYLSFDWLYYIILL